MSSDTYNFNLAFQEKILALLVRDIDFMVAYRDVIKPFFFENPIHVDVARTIISYHDTYSTIATVETCLNLVDEYLEKKLSRAKNPEEQKRLYYKVIDSIYSMDFPDGEYVKDKAVQFAKFQAMKEAILKSVDLLQEGKQSEIEDIIRKAQLVGENTTDLGLFYFDNIEERLNETIELNAEGVLPTGSKDLDEALGGGLGNKELGFILAPPNVGKTLRLINLATGALWQRKTVVHYTLEMSEIRVANRYDANLTNQTFEDMKENPLKLPTKLEQIKKMTGGNLIIKAFPTSTATVNDLRSHLTRLQNYRGVKPDLVIVDYADLLRFHTNFGDVRHNISEVNKALRAVAIERNCPLWTASQTNRAALDKKIITIADLAEDFSKAAIADVIVALCQTPDEYDTGLMREFIAKSRNSKKFQILQKVVDYMKMKVHDDGLAQAV